MIKKFLTAISSVLNSSKLLAEWNSHGLMKFIHALLWQKVAMLVSFFFLGLSNYTFSQWTYKFEFGIGPSPYPDYIIAETYNGSIGYCFFKELNVYTGINVFSQGSTSMLSEVDEYEYYNYYDESEFFPTIIFQAGINQILNLKVIDHNEDERENCRIGIFPEVNGYFTPRLYRYFNREGIEYTGPRMSQLSYGVGGGILYGTWKMYVALKYECNTIDNLESIKK
jgi:hypothetical protein